MEVPKEIRELSIAVTSIADSLGIALAGFTCKFSKLSEYCVQILNLVYFKAIPVHNAICDYGDR
jgi:hypothetical protein